VKRFVLLLFLGAGLTGLQAADLLRLEQSLEAMGSVYTVVAYGEDRAGMLAAVDDAFEEVRRIDRFLSNYRADSELSRLNREAFQAPVRVGEEMFRLLERCEQYSRLSQGAFDITVGPLMRIWGFYKGSGRLPHRAEIRGVYGRIGFDKVVLDRAARTVRFTREGMELDPGGIGKGYAVDRMVEILKAGGVASALVSSGNSSIYAIGSPPRQNGWRVSIRHPQDPGRAVEELELRNESMSTSGTSEKFFRAQGRLYSHIMDPKTGYPAQGMLSVSVVAPKTIDSEAWTKPVFIRGREWTRKHLQNNPVFQGYRFYMCEDRQGGSKQACAWLQ
jgi:thiamine biosynthesis lipoprotein